MRRECRCVATVGLLIALSGSARAQSANKIIDEYWRVEGGRKALEKISTTSYEGSAVDTASGKVGSYALMLAAPSRLYSEVILGADRTAEGYNGKSAWRETGDGLGTLTGAEATRLAATARFLNARLLNLKQEKLRARFAGQENLNGRPAYRVEVTTSDGLERSVFFDVGTHLIVEITAPAAARESSAAPSQKEPRDAMFHSDYRPVDGVMEPFKIEENRSGHRVEITLTRVAHNTSIDAAVFDFPRRSNAPLPDVASLVNDVMKNQKAIDALVENYACHKTDEEYQTDRDGHVKEKSVKEYEVFYLGGREVDRLVRKDGKDLSPDEAAKESGRVEKHIRDYQHHQEKQAAAREEKKKEEDPGISAFLRVDQFRNPRRERFRGHDVIVFDFEPNPAYKPKNLTESLIQKLVGVAWVDEQAHDVARLEARFNDSMKIGGGLLASIQKGSAFIFEQTMVNNEVWLPSYAEGHLSARLLLLKGLKADFVTHYSDYKKFRVETVVKSVSGGPATKN